MIKLILKIRNKISLIKKKIVVNLYEIVFYYFYSFIPNKYGLNKTERKEKIVVSLTSFPERYQIVHLAIKSILYQTYKPDKIILYLDEEHKDIELPKKLKKMEKYGLSIEYRPYNIKPHKKYYFAILENPKDIIITIDDDKFYERNLIKNLYNSYRLFPACVSAKRVHKMQKGKKYNEWRFQVSSEYEPSHALFATGVGGVLYPPQILPKETFDIELITKYCLGQDDIWLKYMEIKNDVKVVFVKGRMILPITIRNSQKVRLSEDNVDNEKNDFYILQMEKLMNISLDDFCD